MKEKTFEELINELSVIVADLEKGSLSLEDAVVKYQRGMELSLECKKRLDEAKDIIVNKVVDKKEVPLS